MFFQAIDDGKRAIDDTRQAATTAIDSTKKAVEDTKSMYLIKWIHPDYLCVLILTIHY